MPTTQESANLRSAQNVARVKAGLPPDSQLPDNELSYTQRNAYNKALAAIIAANPSRFPPALEKVATDVVKKNYEPLTSTSLSESAAIFAEEVGNQASKINATFNPFSEEKRAATASTLKWLLIALAVGSFAVYFGPALFSGGQRLRAAGKRSTV